MTKKAGLLLLLVLVFAAACSRKGAATKDGASGKGAEPKIKVLIVDGFSNHDWRQTTALIRAVLEGSGRCEVAVSTAPPTKDAPGWEAWRPAFERYDVVVQTCNDINGGPRWPRAVEEALEQFMKQGGGLLAFHSGNNAFRGWTEYEKMVGLLWRGKEAGVAVRVEKDETLTRIPAGEGKGTGHEPRANHLVTRLGDDAIHAGMPRRWMSPGLEVYTYARGPAENLQVLSYAADPKTGEQWPIEWTVQYGKGRVYSSTMGHVWKGDVQPASMRAMDEQTLLVRAVQWLAGRVVDWPVPATFPTAEKVSLGPEFPASALPGASQ